MGIYSSRFLESAIDDSFNTPGDIGIDLKQVEEDIAGHGGIAAHEPEIDDAVEGVVGDPLEEAFMIMFESEYNYNQIMEAVGMYELQEASCGREVIYESVNIKGFFQKVKEWLVNLFKSIAKAFKSIIDKISSAFRSDKAFVSKYKDSIQRGAAAMKNSNNWPEGYNIKLDTSKLEEANGLIKDIESDTKTALDKLKNSKIDIDMSDFSAESGRALDKEVLSGFCGSEVDTISDMVKKLTEECIGKKRSLKGVWGADDVIRILEGDNEVKKIKEIFEKLKKAVNAAMKATSDFEKAALKNSSDYQTPTANIMVICDFNIKRMKTVLNASNASANVFVKAAKMKRSQARRLAVWFKNNDPGDKKSKSTNESGFMSMQFI